MKYKPIDYFNLYKQYCSDHCRPDKYQEFYEKYGNKFFDSNFSEQEYIKN